MGFLVRMALAPTPPSLRRRFGPTSSIPDAGPMINAVFVGYAGQYTDAESGLIYLRARYYDPATGQFMTGDPLVALTGEAYGYAGDNPLNAVDPLGLWSWHETLDVLNVGSTILSAGAVVLDAFGVTAPIGVALGEASAGLSLASAGVQCHYGRSGSACHQDLLLAAGNVLTAGVGSELALGPFAEASKGALAVVRGAQFTADAGGLIFSYLSMASESNATSPSGSHLANLMDMVNGSGC